MRFTSLAFPAVLLPFAGLAATPIAADTGPAPEEIIVTAQFRAEETLRRVPASVAVLDADAVRDGALQHFEELVPLVPNLNWSGEGARARYFQVRGAGELEQYEGAPNPSVGFVIDDMDFSGLGGIATTFDTSRVEVLRGPQATRYGANALAGLIYVSTAAPGDVTEAHAEALAGSDGTWGLAAAGGGPVPGIEDRLGYRLAVQQFRSDGFRDNAWLGRDDTANRDEVTARGKLRWRPAAGWQVDFTGLYTDIDDGYDDWAIDNGFTTQSDQPGRDSQRTRAASARVTGDLDEALSLVAITAATDSDVTFSFDSDWGNPALWAPDVYAYTQRTDRRRHALSQELRLLSRPDGRLFGRADWLAGVYAQRLTEDNAVTDAGLLDLDDAACPAPPDPGAAYCAPFATDRSVSSDYRATSLSLYGELSVPLDAATRIALGLRGERRDADYADQLEDRVTPATASNRFSPTDRLWGGDLTLTHEAGAQATLYGRIARGYRAGGFNPGLARTDFSRAGLNVSPEQIEFDPEWMWNYEVGAKLRDAGGRGWLNLSLFLQDRHQMQVKVPVQLAVGDPNTFVFVTDNAEAARAWGLEAEAGWRLTDTLTLRGGVGLLETDLERFDAAPEFEGREFPHAPPVSYAVGALWQGATGWFADVDLAGRAGFYFDYDASTGDDRKSDPAAVVNLRAGLRRGRWEAWFWARNLFDESYATRGFYFGNEPPYFPATRYIRLGDPRQLGVTLAWRL